MKHLQFPAAVTAAERTNAPRTKLSKQNVSPLERLKSLSQNFPLHPTSSAYIWNENIGSHMHSDMMAINDRCTAGKWKWQLQECTIPRARKMVVQWGSLGVKFIQAIVVAKSGFENADINKDFTVVSLVRVLELDCFGWNVAWKVLIIRLFLSETYYIEGVINLWKCCDVKRAFIWIKVSTF